MSTENQSLIFIPDITGFTKFVNETEISHAQHIISELLEILIHANELKMKVSEIEGDAVLFYKLGDIPSIAELINQAELMFLNFHNHLKDYEVRRICNCGACTGTSSLSLKIIVHQGELGFTNVRNVSKPFGKEVVLAHRLLKNDAEGKEYMLFSEPFEIQLVAERPSLPEWVETINASSHYKDIGDIKYQYIPLTSLRDKISTPDPIPPPQRKDKPWIHEIFIECEQSKIYNFLISLELRQLWNEDVEEVLFEKDRVNRVGTRHQCLFPVGMAEFETFTEDFGDDKMVYGEQVMDVPFTKALNVYYVLMSEQSGTRIKIELHHFPAPVLGWIMTPFLKMKMLKGIKKGAKSLKKLCESSEAVQA
ncbi:MAG: DUF2652 domain-containing protein [Bacteroidota bacterium]